MKKNMLIAFVMVLGLLTAAGAQVNSPDGLPGSEQPATGKVVVDSMDVLIIGTFPRQVQVKVRGKLTNGCLKLTEPIIRRQDKTFYISIDAETTEPAEGVACTEALEPFDMIIPLDVDDVPVGEYTVNANGTTMTFKMK